MRNLTVAEGVPEPTTRPSRGLVPFARDCPPTITTFMTKVTSAESGSRPNLGKAGRIYPEPAPHVTRAHVPAADHVVGLGTGKTVNYS